MAERLKPLHDIVLIRQCEPDRVTAGGIHIPDTAVKKSYRGVVVAVGRGTRRDDGGYEPMNVSVGQHIIFDKYAGQEYELNGETLLLLHEPHVLSVVEQVPDEPAAEGVS